MATRDQLEESILDAALERILQVGIRRASLDDIARRAGVNRVTIYRRFRVKENLVDTVLQREISRVLAEIGRIMRSEPEIDTRIEEALLFIVQQTRTHPLVTQLLDVAPDEAVEFFTVRGEELVSQGIRYIQGVLLHSQQEGMFEKYDVAPVAELLARFAHSLLLTPVGGTNFADDDLARGYVRTALVPLVKFGIPQSA
ncbi:putative transcriptional regulator, TetR family [Nocardia nova SH22a]|uniref:Putative transcriptional regulator, TetR family n=1 Tax=Nocardia nova SH22a TaxID=1415166 RepID=W5TQQ4_9NOCA|nr:TetR/AcrR family transcriptional regulator [Nocardia nova]AHH19576.1 putative transcriptional regulator, TetR family [Nocardia nova SH22a]